MATGSAGVFLGAASIFVAYEGFELLSFDYEDLENPARTLPRALYLSVGTVAAVYLIVTVGSQMLVSDEVLVARKEVAFTEVGQAALGPLGRWVAGLAAALATSSAVHATLFSTARFLSELGRAGEVPERLGAAAGIGCAVAIGLLCVQLVRDNPASMLAVGVTALLVGGLRIGFLRYRRKPKQRLRLRHPNDQPGGEPVI